MNQSPEETALSKASIQWGLSRAVQIAETRTSWVYRAERGEGRLAALKLFKPGAGADGGRASAMLEWYDGQGAAMLFGASPDAVLMEWLDGISLGEPARAGRDEEATLAFCTTLAQLHQPRTAPPPESLRPLRARFEPLFKDGARLWPRTARDLYARATGIGLGLFDRPSPDIALHGDLHHDTIVSSPRGWLAIAPLGLLGEATYDAAGAFVSPAGSTSLSADPARIARLAETFSARLGFDRKRLLGFAVAHAALTACDELERGNAITAQLAILPNLLAAYDKV